eukprot:maker-scaffold_4-snap-gene-4.38-mRNA-1 protein AED:0.34 eAED:0.34 QI:0/0/0.5/1/0/0/2/59/439
MTETEELPTIKDKIFFADDFNQACKMLDNDASYSSNEALSGQMEDLNKLMFFGVEGWNEKKNKGKLSKSMQNFDLAEMELFGCELGTEGTKELADGMQNAIKNPEFKLKKLELDHSPLKGSDAVQTIFENLGADCEELNLQGSVEDGDVLEALLKGLANNTTVKKLDLKINKLKGDHFKPFEDFFKQNSSLKDLELFYNEVGAGALYLAKGLMSPNCVLERLNLSCNNLGSEGLFKFTRCIGITKHLKVLDISLNNIGDDAMVPFLTLAAGIELVHVPLPDDRYKPTYTVQTQEFFEKVYDGRITRTPAQAKAEQSGGKFERVDLKPDDPEFEEQYQEVIDHMEKFEFERTTLTWLDISANNITDKGTGAIGMCIKQNHNLEHFDFTGIEATKAGWEDIYKGCEANIDYMNNIRPGKPAGDQAKFYYKRRNEKAAEQKA